MFSIIRLRDVPLEKRWGGGGEGGGLQQKNKHFGKRKSREKKFEQLLATQEKRLINHTKNSCTANSQGKKFKQLKKVPPLPSLF